jgi:hypothetical protein
MSEAEVILRLAFFVFSLHPSPSSVTVGLDRLHLHSDKQVTFPFVEFLRAEGWILQEPHPKHSWCGTYSNGACILVVIPDSRKGDVIASIGNKRLRAECKKGDLIAKRGSHENKLIHEAIGQLMTIEQVEDNDVLVVAVPATNHHQSKVRWQSYPLMQRVKISIVTVARTGQVYGFPTL